MNTRDMPHLLFYEARSRSAPLSSESRSAKKSREKRSRATLRRPRDLLRCSLRHNAAALVARSGTDVDDPVASGHHAHVVLPDDVRIPGLDEPIELRHQLFDVRRMQPGGGLIEHVEGVAALLPLQLGGELDPLSLAARELGGGLAQAKIAEPYFPYDAQRAHELSLTLEELPRGVDG